MGDEALKAVLDRFDRLEAKVDQIHVATVRDEDDFHPDRIYTAGEIATKLGLTRQAIYNAMDAGRLPGHSVGSVRKRQAKGSAIIAWRRG